ncbi:glycogen debranching enzyme, partial [bacterium]|nr:glycogen debranching enzyme [bacterium]
MRSFPHPLGATVVDGGVNFSLFSRRATGVTLCLYDRRHAGEPSRVIPLKQRTHNVWHVFVPDLRPGQLYGYRVDGPFDPSKGLFFNPHKLLLDPYAKAIDGEMTGHPSLFSYDFADAAGGLSATCTEQDSLGHTLLSVVVNPFFDWGKDRAPGHRYADSVIYEAHVKGLTMLNPEIPPEIRGTYAAVGHPATIAHLRDLGVTALELMPVHQFVQDFTLLDKGLRNYWGYNTIGFFAPHYQYAATHHAGAAVAEFKTMVRSFHEAGIEVILDVVYNHTAEGNHHGPTLSFRGIDNHTYYRLVEDD